MTSVQELVGRIDKALTMIIGMHKLGMEIPASIITNGKYELYIPELINILEKYKLIEEIDTRNWKWVGQARLWEMSTYRTDLLKKFALEIREMRKKAIDSKKSIDGKLSEIEQTEVRRILNNPDNLSSAEQEELNRLQLS